MILSGMSYCFPDLFSIILITNTLNFTLIYDFPSGVFGNDDNRVEFKKYISIKTTYAIASPRLGLCL